MSELDASSVSSSVSNLGYLLATQRTPQWNELLRVLGDELGGQMGVGQLRGLFHTLGRRIALASPLSATTLPALQDQINAWLLQRGWGWVQIHDRDDWLDLEHRCAPLRVAFGDDSLRWSTALLEGLYSGWLRAAGASEMLDLRQQGTVRGPDDFLQFRFAHQKLLA